MRTSRHNHLVVDRKYRAGTPYDPRRPRPNRVSRRPQRNKPAKKPEDCYNDWRGLRLGTPHPDVDQGFLNPAQNVEEDQEEEEVEQRLDDVSRLEYDVLIDEVLTRLQNNENMVGSDAEDDEDDVQVPGRRRRAAQRSVSPSPDPAPAQHPRARKHVRNRTARGETEEVEEIIGHYYEGALYRFTVTKTEGRRYYVVDDSDPRNIKKWLTTKENWGRLVKDLSIWYERHGDVADAKTTQAFLNLNKKRRQDKQKVERMLDQQEQRGSKSERKGKGRVSR
jgi:hypothetical protein